LRWSPGWRLKEHQRKDHDPQPLGQPEPQHAPYQRHTADRAKRIDHPVKISTTYMNDLEFDITTLPAHTKLSAERGTAGCSSA
jgi:hypothetical protein